MVMPRSRSWSIESITRSDTSSCALNTPDWRSIASTSVVLPWSTCAMIATLRMSERAAIGRPPTIGRGSRCPGRTRERDLAAAREVALAGLHQHVAALHEVADHHRALLHLRER